MIGWLFTSRITDTDECFEMSLRQSEEADFNNEQNQSLHSYIGYKHVFKVYFLQYNSSSWWKSIGNGSIAGWIITKGILYIVKPQLLLVLK